MFIPFFYLLRDYGIPVSMQQVLEFYRALDLGLAPGLPQLCTLMRLVFVKKVEHFHPFEQAFAAYFYGSATEPPLLTRWQWDEERFRRWLQTQVDQQQKCGVQSEELNLPELLERFLQVAAQQQHRHRGGHTWIGTEGDSDFGHSGLEEGGIRVYGDSHHQSALKVIDSRRYVDYAADAPLSADNLRQALASLRHLVPAGPATELDTEETISRSARSGGDIQLIFRPELRNRLRLVVLLDNGGSSMRPFVPLVRLVFAHLREHVRELDYFYFHNCIYGCVYRDTERRVPYHLHEFLRRDPETKLIFIGDANMAPAELLASNGAIDYFSKVPVPGREWLQQLRQRFPGSVWLNPIPRQRWPQESRTIEIIATIIPMEDLTLRGIRRAVELLNRGGGSPPTSAG